MQAQFLERFARMPIIVVYVANCCTGAPIYFCDAPIDLHQMTFTPLENITIEFPMMQYTSLMPFGTYVSAHHRHGGD